MKTNPTHGEVTGPDSVRFEVLLPGPIERVWSYLVDSEKRAKWLASGPMELRPGGKVALTFHNGELAPPDEPVPEKHAQHTGPIASSGKIVHCEAPHRLSFTWDEEDGAYSEVTFELSRENDEVRLTLTHRRLRNREEIVGVCGGWYAHLAVLLDHLNGRQPVRFWANVTALEEEYEQRIPADTKA